MATQQYASSVFAFSSQWGTSSWSAQQVLGAPNTLSYGDLPTAWATRLGNADGDYAADEFITVGFQTATYANRIEIRESLGNGFVRSVDLLDSAGIYHTIWSGQDPSRSGTPVNFSIVFDVTSYLVVGARINIDIDHNLNTWEEIDSVQLFGVQQNDQVGNTLATARSLGNLNNIGSARFSDFVGDDDPNDYYSFSISNFSSFRASLVGLSADADLQIFNSDGVVIARSYNIQTQDEFLSLNIIAAGNYYARVYQYVGTTPYTINLSAAPLDYAGNTLSTARNLGTLGFEPQVCFDWIGSSDTNDLYQFTLERNSNLSLILDGLNSDADLRLIRDVNNNGLIDVGEELDRSIFFGTATDVIIQNNLAAGTYFVWVNAIADTNYRLTLLGTPLDFAGNSQSTARNIGALGSTIQTFSDFVGTPDTNDFYRFTLDNNSNFNLQLNGVLGRGEISADVDVQLLRLNLDGTLSIVGSSMNSGRSAENINIENLAPSTYFVRVYQYSGDSTYTLNLSATPFTPGDNAGNILGTARDVGTLSSSERSFTDWVGVLDSNDYYRFSLATNSNLNLRLDGLSADADLELIRDTNNNGQIEVGDILRFSNFSGITTESIDFANLGLGTYFVRVYNFNRSNTSYSLNLNALALSTTADWFDLNLSDREVISLTRNLATDNLIGRDDMINLFRNVQDGGLVDVTEQSDLRTIVDNFLRFNMPDYVRYLSGQVVNRIAENSSTIAEEALIGRYFLGTVTPQNSFESDDSSLTLRHVAVRGSLFGASGRANLNDIDQGGMGNCAFLAALGSVLGSRPDIINSMLIDNNDNTYTVRFYSGTGGNGSVEYVTVDRRLAVDGNNRILFAGVNGTNPDNSNNILWAALVERAYAQWREFREGGNGYNLIGNGDSVTRPVGFITGRTSTLYLTATFSFANLQSNLLENRSIIAGSLRGIDTTFIVGTHAYSVLDAFVDNRGEQRVLLRNPWGIDTTASRVINGQQLSGENDGFIVLTFDQFRSSFLDLGIA